MIYPKVLIVSNNSISKSSNTGRTLAHLFSGWPKDRLAQFCISTTEPDYDVCDNYYLLTDRSVLEGFKHFRKGKRCDIESNVGTEGNTIIRGEKAFKSPLKMLARHIVWCGSRWESDSFLKWVDDFNPAVVFLWNSDCVFILDIARSISLKKCIPIVIYNTEGYYCFDRNIYTRDKLVGGSLYSIYHYIYKRHFQTMMKRAPLTIHLNSLLRDDYQNALGGDHMVLYTGSNLRFDSSNLHLDSPSFNYLGNLGFERHTSLIEIAEVLQSINKSYKLGVYGQAPTQIIENELRQCQGIEFHGMVPYDEVVKVIYSSTVLFHTETQKEEYKYYLRYGFSTKIGDSISSGHPFLIYSSKDIAGAKYVIETGAAWYANDKDELKKSIISILTDNNERKHILDIARMTAQKNHDANRNTQIIREELVRICNKENLF